MPNPTANDLDLHAPRRRPARLPHLSPATVLYADYAIWGYLLYVMGGAAQYLRADLGLDAVSVGLHASLLAVGVLVSGVAMDAVAARLGARRTYELGIATLAGAAGLVAAAPALAISLAGAFLVGLGGGGVITYANARLGGMGDRIGRMHLNRINALAMLAAIGAPVVLSSAASAFHTWRLALLLPVVCLATIALAGRVEDEADRVEDEADRVEDEADRVEDEADRSKPINASSKATAGAVAARVPGSRLPAGYWPAWVFIVLVVSIEFSFVYWGSAIVAQRTGLSRDAATLLASLFVAGMLLGRVALGAGFRQTAGPHALLTAGLALALAGASLVWLGSSPALAGIGLALGGLGTAGLYPVGLSVALARAPQAQLTASARATLASGVAILGGPLILGVVSDAVGVATAWGCVVGLALAALAVLAVLASGPAQGATAG